MLSVCCKQGLRMRRPCFLWYNELTEGLSEAFLEGWGVVGVDSAVILFQGIEHLGDEQPLVAWGSFDLFLGEAITHCDVSLVQGNHVSFLKRLCVCLPTWAAQRSRTVACAMPSMPSLSMAINDGVNLN